MNVFKIGGFICFLFSYVHADGPKDNHPESVRRVPKLGIELSDSERKSLDAKQMKLASLIAKIKGSDNKELQQYLGDVEIYHKAVFYALKHREFLMKSNVKWGDQLLDEGLNRAESLLKGEIPWLKKTGPVIRGFYSRLDGSVQPYVLEVPAAYFDNKTQKHRLDIWLHGRGETQLEVSFMFRKDKHGKFKSSDYFTLHPYGRYSNAFKFAGEVDVFEALEHVKASYRIDDNRIANRGFSMGGAGCWQLAVHYPDRWFASNPGAGFSETPEFLKLFQQETLKPKWFEKKLWQLYDCPGYVINLKNHPLIAYSGEDDRQIQAARQMEQAYEKEEMKLPHIIGPKTGHKVHPESAQIIQKWMAEKAKLGRPKLPDSLEFSTYSLKYNKIHWLTIDRLQEHWSEARISASLKNNVMQINTKNINAFHLRFEKDQKLDFKSLIINGQSLKTNWLNDKKGRSYQFFIKDRGKWRHGRDSVLLSKRHNLQGPVDDAFMDSFIMVLPTGTSPNKHFDKWSKAEANRAIEHWRRHFRGDAVVKTDKELNMEDIINNHLILWGDTDSNAFIKKIIDKLPVKWTAKKLTVNDKVYGTTDHALIMIYPNPLNPIKYIVLNSGFTFRDYAYLNNARQVPMLPDWAVIDLKTKPGTVWPGKVTDAGFFDEFWRMKK